MGILGSYAGVGGSVETILTGVRKTWLSFPLLWMRMSNHPRGPPQLPEEEPAIPLEPAVAKARVAYIRSQIEKIRVLKGEGKTRDEIIQEVARFAEDYPTLFKMAVQSDLKDNASFRTMLAMLDRMGSGDLTQHQASVIVGQRLHDTYIKPRLDESEGGSGGGI
jgi:hypothetical protein